MDGGIGFVPYIYRLQCIRTYVETYLIIESPLEHDCDRLTACTHRAQYYAWVLNMLFLLSFQYKAADRCWLSSPLGCARLREGVIVYL